MWLGQQFHKHPPLCPNTTSNKTQKSSNSSRPQNLSISRRYLCFRVALLKHFKTKMKQSLQIKLMLVQSQSWLITLSWFCFVFFLFFALLELLEDIWNRDTHNNVLQFSETPGKSKSVIYIVQLPDTILFLFMTTEILSLNRLIDVICAISALTVFCNVST